MAAPLRTTAVTNVEPYQAYGLSKARYGALADSEGRTPLHFIAWRWGPDGLSRAWQQLRVSLSRTRYKALMARSWLDSAGRGLEHYANAAAAEQVFTDVEGTHQDPAPTASDAALAAVSTSVLEHPSYAALPSLEGPHFILGQPTDT